MKQIFREKWTSKWADNDKRISHNKYEELKNDYDFVLKRLTYDQVAWALKLCLDKNEIIFPPVPKDFYNLAKTYEPPIENPKQLPKPTLNQEKFDECWNEINRILGRKSKLKIES